MLSIGLSILLLTAAISSTTNSPNFNGIAINRIVLLLFIFCFYLSYNTIYFDNIKDGVGIYNGLFLVTTINQNLDCFIYILGALILCLTAFNNFNNKILDIYNNNIIFNNKYIYKNISSGISEYPIIILFNIIGATLLMSSRDLVSMYLAIELQSFALYILATIYRDSPSSARAGLKYFLLGGLSSCFILLGVGLLYTTTGLTNLESIFILYNLDYSNLSLQLSLLILIVGFLFKIAAAPLHNWAPDVYDGVPTIVTTWLSVMTKISISIFLIDIVESTTLNSLWNENIDNSYYLWTNLLLLSSLLSLIIGSVVGLVQYRIKRLLAYSTISHIGFLTLALAMNTEETYESYLFYLVQYSITNANNFFIIIAFGWILSKIDNNSKYNIYSPIQYIDQLKGQFYYNPLLSLCFAISLFSLAGIPPLIGFFGKQAVLLSALHNGYLGITLIAILTSVISASYYLRIIRMMYFEVNNNNLLTINNNNINNDNNIYLSNGISFIIAILTLFTVFFFLKPYLILNWAHLLAISIYYF